MDETPDELTARFCRLSVEDRARLGHCLSLSPRLRELTHSHPLAALAFSQSYGPDERRTEALQRLQEGQGLRRVCQSLAIPYSFRGIPAQACPARLGYFDWPARANKQLRSSIPEDPLDIPNWLEVLFYGARAAGPEFGLWIAQNAIIFECQRVELHDMLPLALYAWYSSPRTFLTSQLTRVRWQNRMSLRTACARTARWLEQIELSAYTDRRASSHALFDFVELRTLSCIKEEAAVMKNCLESYGSSLNSGRIRLFGVRHNGARLATMEIEKSDETWVVRQILGMKNRPVADIVRMVAKNWIERLPNHDSPFNDQVIKQSPDEVMLKYFSAYCQAQQAYENWIPEITLAGLLGSVEKLSAMARIVHGGIDD